MAIPIRIPDLWSAAWFRRLYAEVLGRAATTDDLAAHNANAMAHGGILRTGVGSPEGVVLAPTGTLYVRQDGEIGATLYVKESGADVTGWVAK